jgi:hypothetical protein
MYRKIILNIIFGLLMALPAVAQGDWKFAKEEDGIKVYSKTVPESKVKALKVECIINSGAAQLVALLMDVKAAERWVSHTKSCSLIRKVSAAELYYYSEVSLPWPLENRDFVAHVKVSQDPVTKVITVNAPAIPGVIAAKKGIVRVNQSKGFWVITPLDKGTVKVSYTLQVDPGGIIPAWAVNSLSSQGPLESFQNMRRELPKYKNVSLPFIVD